MLHKQALMIKSEAHLYLYKYIKKDLEKTDFIWDTNIYFMNKLVSFMFGVLYLK